MITQSRWIAWAAGLFEGEGWIVVERNERTGGVYLSIGLNSTDRDVVERLAEVVGCGSVSLRKPHRSWKPHYKDSWLWTVRSTEAVAVLRLFLPYLGERRSARANEALRDFAARVAEIATERECESCGRKFTPGIRAGAQRQIYCTKRCKERARRWRRAGGREAYYAAHPGASV